MLTPDHSLKSFRKMPDRIWPRRMVGPVKTISNFADHARPMRLMRLEWKLNVHKFPAGPSPHLHWARHPQQPFKPQNVQKEGHRTHLGADGNNMVQPSSKGLHQSPSVLWDASWDSGSKEMPCRMSPGRGGPVFPFTSTFSRLKKPED